MLDTNKCFSLLIILLILMIVPKGVIADNIGSPGLLPSHPDDIYWANGFTLPGEPNDVVEAIVVYDGKLVIGGRFTEVSGVTVNHIAAWDGQVWSSLGSGCDDWVIDLVVYDGLLIGCGHFYNAGSIVVKRIAAWDGSSWSDLAGGIAGGSPRAIVVYDGDLIVGGLFTTVGGVSASYIASWDGSSWAPLGSGLGNVVSALTVSDGELIVGGGFTTAGGVPAVSIASWNGTTWAALGSGILLDGGVGIIDALTAYDGLVIAGGLFTSAGGVPVNNIAQWDGMDWGALATGVDDRVLCFTEFGSQLIVGGYFANADGIAASEIAQWNGTSWSPLGPGVTDGTWVNSLAVYDGKLVAVGGFTAMADVETEYLATWDGTDWSSISQGLDGTARAMVIYNSQLVVGGKFTEAGGMSAVAIAAWDGLEWHPLGTGPGLASTAGEPDPEIFDMIVYDGALVVCGEFDSAGGVSTRGIAAWNGSTWSPLGDIQGMVRALDIYDGDLIAGGGMLVDGAASYLASWDGSVWTDIAPGMDYLALSLKELDGILYVGGLFQIVDGVAASYIASYDGVSWSALGSGVNAPCCNFEEYEGDLLVGAGFTDAGGTGASYLALWDGLAWAPFPSPVDDVVWELYNYDGATIVSGAFATVGTLPVSGVASWNGLSWTELGSGIEVPSPSGYVLAIADFEGDLYFGGAFSTAGGKTSDNIASWTMSFGACCFDDGSCQLETADGCLQAGGEYAGDDTMCAGDSDGNMVDDACEGGLILMSACCYGSPTSPSCVMTVELACEQDPFNGTYYRGHHVCSRNTCPDGGPGACCVETGTGCEVLYEAHCAEAGGTYLGEGTTCDQGTCGSTQPGTNVVVDAGNGVQVTFSTVTSGGITTASTGKTGPAPPNDFQIVPVSPPTYYDVSTTASFTGTITVCLTYDEADVAGPEADLTLWHDAGSGWVDVTISVDVDNNIICGEVNSLSPFIIAELIYTGCCVDRVGDANGLGGDEPTIGDIGVMIDAKFITGTCVGILDCFTEADINQTGGLGADCDDITIGDISTLIDYLFIGGPGVVILPNCL